MKFFITSALLILFISSISFFTSAPNIPSNFQKGISFKGWDSNNIYNTSISDFSISELSKTGANYVALTSSWFQNDTNSTHIYTDRNKTPSDLSMIHAINKIHSLGMKVMLKPHLRLQNHEWCAYIHFNKEEKWERWFEEYKEFISHCARMAEENGVEEFCIGVELRGSIERNEWKDVIKVVRKNYSGSIVYAANWDSYKNIKWWNMLDFIGIDAYFPLINKKEPSIKELVEGWRKWHDEIKDFSEEIGKKVIFTEIGYCSQDGTNMEPGNPEISNKIDLQEQADCYNATFMTFWNEKFMRGIFWWEWYADGKGGEEDKYYTPYKKPAEDVIKFYYIPKIKIIKPVKGVYILDKKIYSYNEVLIIGGITIEVGVNFECNEVEFYVDNELKYVDTMPPYRWKWNEFAFGKHEIKISSDSAYDEKLIYIFNL